MTESIRTTKITVHCHDGTKRLINVIGLWNAGTATSLGKDIEKENFKFVTVNVS